MTGIATLEFIFSIVISRNGSLESSMTWLSLVRPRNQRALKFSMFSLLPTKATRWAGFPTYFLVLCLPVIIYLSYTGALVLQAPH